MRRTSSYDAWIYHNQLDELAALADAFPDTPIVLDHIGGLLGIGPYEGKREQTFELWRDAVSRLAQRDNVCVKLGGLAMKQTGLGLHRGERPPDSASLAHAFRPYFAHCIERFGAARCMFESNFPVDKVSCGYGVLWNAFKRVSSDCSADERKQLFRDTALRVYRLA